MTAANAAKPRLLHRSLSAFYDAGLSAGVLQVIVAIGFAGVALLMSVVVGRVGKRNPVKTHLMNGGMIAQGEAQPRFSVKFYLVAMLFILFDIEIVFMYPWAVVYRDFIAQYGALPILGSMVSFHCDLDGWIYLRHQEGSAGVGALN